MAASANAKFRDFAANIPNPPLTPPEGHILRDFAPARFAPKG
jgi:hypothetical protein